MQHQDEGRCSTFAFRSEVDEIVSWFLKIVFFNPIFRNCRWKFEDDIGYDMDHHP